MQIKKDFILREIAGDYILVPTGSTALNFNGLISLNEVGAFIWKKLEQEITKDEIILSIVKKYDVENNIAKNDLDEFLEYLREREIIA